MRTLKFQDKSLERQVTQNSKSFSLKVIFYDKHKLNKMTLWLSTNQMNIWKSCNPNPLEKCLMTKAMGSTKAGCKARAIGGWGVGGGEWGVSNCFEIREKAGSQTGTHILVNLTRQAHSAEDRHIPQNTA